MSDFTYEFKTSALKLETYEWDNVWLEQAPVKDAKRVLYIGDSISCATRRVATAKAETKSVAVDSAMLSSDVAKVVKYV